MRSPPTPGTTVLEITELRPDGDRWYASGYSTMTVPSNREPGFSAPPASCIAVLATIVPATAHGGRYYPEHTIPARKVWFVRTELRITEVRLEDPTFAGVVERRQLDDWHRQRAEQLAPASARLSQPILRRIPPAIVELHRQCARERARPTWAELEQLVEVLWTDDDASPRRALLRSAQGNGVVLLDLDAPHVHSRAQCGSADEDFDSICPDLAERYVARPRWAPVYQAGPHPYGTPTHVADADIVGWVAHGWCTLDPGSVDDEGRAPGAIGAACWRAVVRKYTAGWTALVEGLREPLPSVPPPTLPWHLADEDQVFSDHTIVALSGPERGFYATASDAAVAIEQALEGMSR